MVLSLNNFSIWRHRSLDSLGIAGGTPLKHRDPRDPRSARRQAFPRILRRHAAQRQHGNLHCARRPLQ